MLRYAQHDNSTKIQKANRETIWTLLSEFETGMVDQKKRFVRTRTIDGKYKKRFVRSRTIDKNKKSNYYFLKIAAKTNKQINRTHLDG